MKTKIEQSSATNPNPVLSVGKDGTILYSNEASEPLLLEWGVGVGEKLPSCIGDFVQRVSSRSSPEKIEVKVGNRVYLVAFHPSPEGECVNIYGFDINDQKELEEKLRIKEKQNDILHQIGKIALEYESIQIFMDESVKLISSILDLEYCKIMELLPDGRFLLRAGIGWKPEFVGKHIVGGEKESQAGYTLLSRIPVIVEDFEEENRFEKPEILKIHSVASGASVVIGSMEKIYGVLVVNSTKKRKFTSDDTYFLNSVAFLIAQVVERKKADEALRESEGRFRSVLENSLDAAYRRDLQTDSYDYMSPVIEQITGFSSMEMSAMSINEALDHMHPDDRSLFASELTWALDAGIGTFDYRFKCKDGNYRWLADYFKVIKDHNGSPLFISGVIRDITERKRAEETLRESEAKYRDLFETVQEVFYIDRLIYDEQGNVVDWIFEDLNPAGFELLGLKDIDEAKGKRGSEVLGREVASFYLPMIEKARRSSKAITFQYHSPYVDREFLTSYIVRGDRLISAQMDITERKQIEDVMRESESRRKVAEAVEVERQRFFNVLETLPAMICLLTPDHHIVFSNRSYREKFGESGGRHCYESRFERTQPCEFCESYKVFETGQTHNWKLTTPDGSVIETYDLPFTDFDGTPLILKMDIDITERKKSEEKLRESEEKYRNIVETANEGILITDNENIITYVNKKFADMLRYNIEEVIGRPIWGFISEEYKPIVKRNLENRMKGISESYELKSIRKDGSSLWLFLNAKPLFDKDGKYMGAMSMLTDIDKRKEAEDALTNIEITRKKEIHHRIKNNLQVISSLLSLQAEKFNNREDIKNLEVLEAFRESQDRVMSIALIHEELHEGGGEDSLNFSRYLEMLVDNLFQTYRLGNANTSLNIKLEDNIFFDMEIAIPLGIIVNELVSNSLKHAFQGKDSGEIRIKLCREKSVEFENEEYKRTNFILIVSDNGVGIPENLDIEDLESLGLQLVTSLVDQLNGELELKTKNGMEFTIRFMVTEKSEQVSAP
jgi:PAS domain S-box-containing protein